MRPVRCETPIPEACALDCARRLDCLGFAVREEWPAMACPVSCTGYTPLTYEQVRDELDGMADLWGAYWRAARREAELGSGRQPDLLSNELAQPG